MELRFLVWKGAMNLGNGIGKCQTLHVVPLCVTAQGMTLWNMLCKLCRCDAETDGTIGIQLNLRLGNSEVEN